MFLPRWRQTTSSKTSRTSSPSSSTPSTASTVPGPISLPPSSRSTSSPTTVRASVTRSSSPSIVSWLPAQPDRAAQAVAQRVEDAVADARQLGGDVVGDRQGFLHPAQCRTMAQVTDPQRLRDEAEARARVRRASEAPALRGRRSTTHRCSRPARAEAAERFGGPLPEEGDGALAALTELVEDGLDGGDALGRARASSTSSPAASRPRRTARTGWRRRSTRTRSRRSARRSAPGSRRWRSAGCSICSSCRLVGRRADDGRDDGELHGARGRPALVGGSSTASTWTSAGSRACRRCRSSRAATSTRARRRRSRCSASAAGPCSVFARDAAGRLDVGALERALRRARRGAGDRDRATRAR